MTRKAADLVQERADTIAQWMTEGAGRAARRIAPAGALRRQRSFNGSPTKGGGSTAGSSRRAFVIRSRWRCASRWARSPRSPRL